MLLGEFPVSCIVARHGHYRASAIAHQDEVCDPERNLLAGQRMDSRDTQRHPLLFHRFQRCFLSICLLALGNESRNIRIHCCRLAGQRMLGRHRHIRYAHERIGTCRVNRQRLFFTRHIK